MCGPLRMSFKELQPCAKRPSRTGIPSCDNASSFENAFLDSATSFSSPLFRESSEKSLRHSSDNEDGSGPRHTLPRRRECIERTE
ncbi:uncharacterized [Tachysurus ichikawai]